MNFEHAARGESAEEGLPDASAVHSRLARERHRLADAGERAADCDLIADLADLTGARLGADVYDPFRVAHALEDPTDARETVRVAADHDRECRVDGANLAS